MGESTTFTQVERTPEQRAARWHALAALAGTIRDDETRAQYLGAWRARFDAEFPPPPPRDADDIILPDGSVVDAPSARERGWLVRIAQAWWGKEAKRLDGASAGQIKAIAWHAGRRVAAGWLDRQAVLDAVAGEIVSQAAWARNFANGMGEPFGADALLLVLRCSHYALTQYGVAERFRARHGANFVYTSAKGWLGWDGRRWAVLDQEQNALPAVVIAAIFETVRSIQDEARLIKATGVPPESVSEKRAAELAAKGRLCDGGLDWAGSTSFARREFGLSCETGGYMAGVATVAKQWLTRPIEAFDCERMAVNCQNGTLRFVKGDDGRHRVQLDPHARDDLITRVAPVAYNAVAVAPLFDALMLWAQPGDDRRRYVRQWLGYNLTGHVGAQIMHFWFGRGANGKSTVIDACAKAAGDYADTIGIETFLDQGIKRRGDAATPDLAKLGGIRMLRASEPDGDGTPKLNEGLVKMVTGGEPLSVRALHKGFFSLRPDFKLTIAANDKFRIKGTDEGIWRRMKLVPWESYLAEGERDADLPVKLEGELAGIFAWLVGGLLDWLDHGFAEPDSVTTATAEYRDDSDPLGRFLLACTEPVDGGRVRASEMHGLYCAWCKAAGEAEWSIKGFGQAMKARGWKNIQSNGMIWLGLKLTRAEGDFVDSHGNAIKGEPGALAGDGGGAGPDPGGFEADDPDPLADAW